MQFWIHSASLSFLFRIDWLQQGSRELFGTVIEDQIYILIDTSASMSPHIQFVKDKLFVLMQEQLRHKQKFNIIAFDSKSTSWRDRVVEVNEKNLHTAWQWIKGLACRGSTNTLAALRHALSDNQTQAVYLLTDGRPDQVHHSNCNIRNTFFTDISFAHKITFMAPNYDFPSSWEQMGTIES